MTTFPPDNIDVGGGVWGTDFDRETSVIYSGAYSIRFKNTTPAADPYAFTKKLLETAPGDVWLTDFIVRADSVAAGNTLTGAILWYDSAQAYLSGSNLFSGVLTAANTWYVYSGNFTAPASAAFARLKTTKKNNAFNAYLDVMGLRRVQPAFLAYRTSQQTIGTGAWTKVQNDVESYDYGANYDNATNYRFTAPTAGVYAASAHVSFYDPLADQKQYGLAIYKNGSNLSQSYQSASVGATPFNPFIEVTVPAVLLASGDYLEVYVYHDHGGNRNIDAGPGWCNFSVTKLQ